MEEDKKDKLMEKKKAKIFVIKNILIFFILLWLSFFFYQYMPDWAKVPFIFTSVFVVGIIAVIIAGIAVAYISGRLE